MQERSTVRPRTSMHWSSASIFVALVGSWLLACTDGSRVTENSGVVSELPQFPAETGGNASAPIRSRVLLAATVAGNAGTASNSSGSGTSGAAGTAGTAGTAGSASSSGAAGAPSVYCGDGRRDLVKEECDDGSGSPGKFCNWACQLQDNWASHSETTLPAGARVTRHLGRGRHPLAANAERFAVAVVEQITPADQQVRVAQYNDVGVSIADSVMSTGTWVADRADPVVAVLSNGDVAAAFTEFGGDKDGLGIALRRLRAGQTTPDAVSWVSSPSFAAQYDPDILALSDRVLVAYTDEYDATTGPDITLRELGLDLKPLSTMALGATGDVEGRVALAKLGDSWGAAWRRSAADGTEYIDAYDAATGTRWSVGPHMAPDSDDQPALVALDATRRLLLYVRDAAPAASNQIYMTGVLYFAVLDTAQPSTAISANPVATSSSLSARRPALLQLGNEAYMAWSRGQRSADPNFGNGEDIFYQRITPTLSASPTFVLSGEQTIPRWASESLADQRVPALALLGPSANQPGSALVSAWEDYGETLGTGSGEPDVVVQMAPLTLKRDATTAATDCTTTATCTAGKGRCTDSNQCASGLVCGTTIGPNFGYAPDVGVCVAAHCTDALVNSGETLLNCGGADCGTCLCGDGIRSPEFGEVCDTAGNSATCDGDCSLPVCGDAWVNPALGEECDLGTAGNNGVTCSAACKNFVVANTLKIMAQRGTATANSQPLTIRISNTGASAQSLTGLTLRYWYTAEGASPLQLTCNSFTGPGCSAVSASVAAVAPVLFKANMVMTITINSTQSIPANTAYDLGITLRKQDSGNFDPANDYSYPTATMGDWNGIAMYRTSTLLWGQLPANNCNNGVANPGETCDPGIAGSNCNSNCSGFNAGKTACQTATGCLSVAHYRTDSRTDNQILPYVMLLNKSGVSVALKQVKIVYWFSADGTTSFTGSCSSSKLTPTATSNCTAASVSFTAARLATPIGTTDSAITMTYAASNVLNINDTTGWMVPRVLRSSGTFNEVGDWSLSTGTASPGVAGTKIAVYVDNVLWWGQEP